MSTVLTKSQESDENLLIFLKNNIIELINSNPNLAHATISTHAEKYYKTEVKR